MGAMNFSHRVLAQSAEEGFNRLVGGAISEYGDRSYNGTISTCSMGRLRQVYAKPTETNRKNAYKFIEKDDYGQKWVADYIDLGVVEYKVLTIKKDHLDTKPAVVRVKYTVRGYDRYDGDGKIEKYFDTKKEADDYALRLAIRNNKQYYTHKEGVVVEGDTRVTKTIIEEKKYKTKPKLKPMPNRKIVEIHEYIFYGWASM